MPQDDSSALPGIERKFKTVKHTQNEARLSISLTLTYNDVHWPEDAIDRVRNLMSDKRFADRLRTFCAEVEAVTGADVEHTVQATK